MIRPASTADIPAILAIWNPLIESTATTFNPTPKTPDDLAAMLAAKAAAGHAFLVAGEPGAVLGFATFGQFRAGAGYARTFEHSIMLAGAARGQGLGRTLLAALEAAARRAGGHSMFAGVSAENPAGFAFHAAAGYAHVATLPAVGWKFGRFIDLHLMQKRLAG